jgi:hypothetical protein
MPYRFPYTAETIAMPENTAEERIAKTHAKARERASRYRQADYEPRRPRIARETPAPATETPALTTEERTAVQIVVERHVIDEMRNELIAINNPLPLPPPRPYKTLSAPLRILMLESATAKGEKWECAICKSDDTPNAEFAITPCGHSFCAPCLQEWVNHTTRWNDCHCPTCREVISARLDRY